MAEIVGLPQIPDFALLRPIGRGAYGEVWLARNVIGSLNAVKIIWRRQFDSERPFERELAGIKRYEPVSRSSGGLVHVLHVGRNDAEGYFYYVMELADPQESPKAEIRNPKEGPRSEIRDPREGGSGLANDPPELRTSNVGPVSDFGNRTLDLYEPRTLRSDFKRLGRIATADCLRLAIDIASGLGQLHRHGLVHRDVKPGNIIYVNGRAKLADIGLVTSDGEGQTFVGTEGYVPPEGPGSPGADLYALGMVLYEASTGFAIERVPDVPEDWLTDSPRDEALELHQIILKACENRREQRYSSVEALQADLAILQAGQSVRHVRALERRYARVRIAGAIVTVLLAGALLVAGFANYRAHVAAENRAREMALRIQAQQSLQRAETAEREAKRDLYAAWLAEAKATVRSGELGQRVRALAAVRRAGAISNTSELRGAAMAAMTLPDFQLEREIPPPVGATLIQFDPAFERMAVGLGDGPVEIHSVAGNDLLATLPASTKARASLAWWSPDGRFLAIKRDLDPGGRKADLEVWNALESKRVLLLHNLATSSVAFHPRLPRVLAGLGVTVSVWDLNDLVQVAQHALPQPPECLTLSPDGKAFAASMDMPTGSAVSVNEVVDGKQIASFPQPDEVLALDWDPTGRWIVVASWEGSLTLIDVAARSSRVLGRHKAQAALALFSPGDKYLLSAGWEREFILWDLGRMERAFTMALDSFRAQFSADGRHCAITRSSAVQLYAFEGPGGRREFDEDLGPRLTQAIFSSNGRWLAAAAADRVGVWDLSESGPAAISSQVPAARLAFSESGELFAATDAGCRRWRVHPATNSQTAPMLEKLPLPRITGFSSICTSSNQVFLTDVRGTGPVSLTEAGAVRTNIVRTPDGITGISPDQRFLAVFAPYHAELRICALPGCLEIAILTNRFNIFRFEFSPRSDEVAVCSTRTVEVWSTSSWHRTRELTNCLSLLYGKDGKTLWLWKDYQNAGLYDARTLDLLLPLPPGTLPLALSPDGHYLAVSADLRHLQLWDLAEVHARLAELGLDWSR